MMTSQAMIGKTAITSAFSIVYVWPLELFPTALRSGAMGIQSFSSRVGAIIAPLVLLMGQPPSPVPYVTTLPPSPLSSALFFGQLEDTLLTSCGGFYAKLRYAPYTVILN